MIDTIFGSLFLRKELTRQEQLEYQVGSTLKKIYRTKGRRYPKKVTQKIYALIKQQSDQNSYEQNQPPKSTVWLMASSASSCMMVFRR